MTRQTDERWIPDDTFGDRLRRIRRQLGLTQTEFAVQLGEGEKAVASWESGIRKPRSEVAVASRIELAFKVPASWVLLGIGGGGGRDGGPDGAAASQLPRLDSNQQPSVYPLSAVA